MTKQPRQRLVLVLCVLVLAAGALTGWLATRSEPDPVLPAVAQDGSYTVGTIPSDDGRAAVTAVATGLPLALSYDFRTLDHGLQEAVSHMTSSFAPGFTDTFNRTARRLAVSRKAVTNASVRAAGLVSVDGDHAVVLAYVDSVLVSSKPVPGVEHPVKVSQNRVIVDVRLENGEWRIDGIRPF